MELLGDGRVHGLGLTDGAGLLVDLEVIPEGGGRAAEEGVGDGRVDGVHVHGLDLLGRHVQDTRQLAALHRGRVLRVDARAVQQHASLVDEAGVLVVIVSHRHRQCRAARQPLRGVPGAVLLNKISAFNKFSSLFGYFPYTFINTRGSLQVLIYSQINSLYFNSCKFSKTLQCGNCFQLPTVTRLFIQTLIFYFSIIPIF